MPEKKDIELVDTTDVLTKDELRELKKLAQASKIVKWFVVTVFGVVSLFGVDKITAFFVEHR